MVKEYLDFFAKLNKPATDPAFLAELFKLIAKDKKKRNVSPLYQLISEEYSTLSERADRSGIQESCSIRNVLKTRELAKLLIDEKGRVDENVLRESIKFLKERLYPLGFDRQYDSERNEALLKAMILLESNAELKKLISSIQRPYQNPLAEQIVRDSLLLPDSIPLTDVLVRQAALASWFCFLRQSVGSCFATAPSILVQREQPELFFRDIRDLLAVGQIKRTYGGVEYAVPLSLSSGSGDLKKPFLLLCQEGETAEEVWLAPGLLSAFEEMGIVDSKEGLAERIKELKKTILDLVLEQCGKEGQFYTTSEELISKALLKKFQLTFMDLEKAKNPKKMGGLMELSFSEGPKEHSIKKYKEMKERAVRVFKTYADCALLKAWEYTVASFAETKPLFTRWNLYASLGLQPDKPGGIGACILSVIQEKLSLENREIHEANEKYEQMYPYIRYLETRLRTAAQEKEIEWLKIDYQNKLQEFKRYEQERESARFRAEWFANLYDVLIYYYDKLFPEYFQEIYDPEMSDIVLSVYDDRPAGFRLIYKYGRAISSKWTRIENGEDFIEALIHFFTSTEKEISTREEFKGFEMDTSQIVTAIISHIREPEFLETAFHRVADQHGVRRVDKPLEHLDKIDKKPWAYTSGGNMDNLVKGYFSRQEPLKEVKRWVESPTELFVFLVDLIKEGPKKLRDLVLNDNGKALLMHSPTHAFLFKPSLKEFLEIVESKEFTYTWIRDQILLKQDRFLERIKLDQRMMAFIIDRLAEKVPLNYRHYFKKVFENMWGEATPHVFAKEIIKTIGRERGLKPNGYPVLSIEEIDSYLVENLPLQQTSDVEKIVIEVIQNLPGFENIEKEEAETVAGLLGKTLREVEFVTAKELMRICFSAILILLGETSYSIDYHLLTSDVFRKLGYLIPKPIIFADSNWVKDKFAFMVSPSSQKLDLWRVDLNGTSGAPMSSWQMWVDGSHREKFWGVYSDPSEYVAIPGKVFGG